MKRVFTLLIILTTLVCHAQIPRNGLVAWYPLNGNTNDSSGNGFNGTSMGPTPVGGECGQGYYCNADYIDCGNPSGQQFDLQNDATLCFWFKLVGDPTGQPAGFAVLGKDVSGGSVPKWFVSVFADSIAFHINSYTYGSGYWRYSNYFHFNLNTFYHVAITKTASTNTYQFFINAVPSGTRVMPVNEPVIPHDMQIGQNEAITTNVVMDEVFIYDVVLNQLQIDTIYNACNNKVKSLFTANDTSICAGSCITFTNSSTGASTYQWSFPGADNPASSNANPGSVCYSTPGTYDVQLIAGNGSISDTLLKKVYITVNPNANAGVIIANPSTLCAGNSVQLSDTGSAGNIQWQSSTNGNSYTNIPGVTSTGYSIPSLSQTTYYRVIAQNGICNPDTSAAQMIGVSATAVAGNVQAVRDSLCQGTEGKLTLANSTGSPIQWQSSSNDTNFTSINSASGTSYTTQPLLQTTFIRVVVGTGACTDTSAALQLYVPPPLQAYFAASISGRTITFNSDSSSGSIKSYVWNFGDNTPTSNSTDPTHTFNTDSVYYVCLTLYDGTNCSYTFCRYISIADGVTPIEVNNQWLIYPNPFENSIIISSNNSGNPIKSFELYDVLGRKILTNNSSDLFQNPVLVNTSFLTAGMYFLRIKTAEAEYQQKLIKQ